MKKITILLIALMVISVGFLSGCNENDLNEDEEKYSEFVECFDETESWINSKYLQLADSIQDENWDDALYYCNQVSNKLDYYISECRDFYVLGILDLARDEYVGYLTLLDDVYIHYKIAVENWEIGFNASGTQHWNIADDYNLQANEHGIDKSSLNKILVNGFCVILRWGINGGEFKLVSYFSFKSSSTVLSSILIPLSSLTL